MAESILGNEKMMFSVDTKKRKNDDIQRFNFDQQKEVKKTTSSISNKFAGSTQSSCSMLERWSPTNKLNVEVADIHPSVPLAIALLHIETDALLDSLRQSALTPQNFNELMKLSPTSTFSTSESTFTGMSLTESSRPPEVLIISTRNSSLEENDSSEVSVDSDDGMSGEIHMLKKVTNDMLNTDVEREYEAFLQQNAKEQDAFLLFVRDLMMVCEDVSFAIIHSILAKKLLHSEAVKDVMQRLRTRPRDTIAFLYLSLSGASILVKTAINCFGSTSN